LEILDVLRGTTSNNVLKKKEEREKERENTTLEALLGLYTHFS
jgi:cobalamin biosynthesis Co2+ chelatase CbiK